MPTVKAKFVESGAGAIANMTVRVWKFDSTVGAFPLPINGVTDAAGEVSLNALVLLVMDPTTSFQLRAENDVGRELWRSALFTAPILTQDFGLVTLPAADLRGLLVTNLTGTVKQLAANNRVMLLVDNAVAWAEVETAVQAARNSLLLQMFYFDVNEEFLRFNPDPPALNVPTTGVRLEDLLLTLNRATPPVAVRILNRAATLGAGGPVPPGAKPLHYPNHTAETVRQFFVDHTPNTVALRDYTTSLRFPMHSKFIVIDEGTGIIIGSPFLQEYFDAKTHSSSDSRRGRMSSKAVDGFIGGYKNSIVSPIHDVSCKITGPAVANMRDTFFLHWNMVGPAESSSAPIPDDPAPNATIQIVRSLPGSTFPGLPIGERGVLEAYLRIFEEATQFVYLENQYLLSDDIISGIRRALTKTPTLEFILVINTRLDIPTYGPVQRATIQRLLDGLKKDNTNNRLGIFCLWTHENAARPRIIRCYVHSKVGIADDKWATIGSANLDGVSLHTGEGAAPPMTPEDEHQRATEVNAVIFDGVAGQAPSTIPGDLRRNLWAEHLGLSESDPSLVTRPAAGWLSLWSAAAQRKLNGLKTNPSVVLAERILPWIPQSKSEPFLKASGIDTRNFDVLETVTSFDFKTGKPI